jgi:hypothetical protein
LTVPLQDRNGNALDVAAVDYRVIKQDGSEVLARTTLDTFSGGSEAVVTVAAGLNAIAYVDPATITAAQLDSVSVREVRTVELFLTVGDNTVLLTKSYALEPADTLVPGLNSFQGLAQAELVSLDIPSLDGWNGANEKDKIAALIEARQRICLLRFAILNSNVNFGQDNLSYVPEGTYTTPYAGMFMFNGNLSLMTPATFVKLPPRFRSALCRAQVAEADSILGGSPLDARRQEGLLLESVGEVKQMFRAGKPLDLPVSRRALRYLGPFVSMAKMLTRG